MAELRVTSPDFASGGRMPDRLSAAHDNHLPVLEVAGVPQGAVELAVICHDPDAVEPGGFTHWLLYGVAPDARRVDGATVRSGRQGRNDLGRVGWYGPKPPPGHGVHRYHLWVYALDTPVRGEPSRDDFLRRYGDHVVAQGHVVGTYSR